MFTRVSMQPATTQKTYEELFTKRNSELDKSWKTYSGEEVILPEGVPLNTLILHVEDSRKEGPEKEVKEVVVNYLGNGLLVGTKERASFTPGLLKHLEMIGRAMFAPDASGNLVINSDRARIDGPGTYIVNSYGAKVENSDKAEVVKSPQTQVVNSTGAKVVNSNEATVVNSNESTVENSYESTVENSPRAKVENSYGAKVVNSNESTVENSYGATVENSDKAEVVKSPQTQVVNSTGAKVVNSTGGNS